MLRCTFCFQRALHGLMLPSPGPIPVPSHTGTMPCHAISIPCHPMPIHPIPSHPIPSHPIPSHPAHHPRHCRTRHLAALLRPAEHGRRLATSPCLLESSTPRLPLVDRCAVAPAGPPSPPSLAVAHPRLPPCPTASSPSSAMCRPSPDRPRASESASLIAMHNEETSQWHQGPPVQPSCTARPCA